MPTWKFDRGENAALEGTVLFSTYAAGPATNYSLAGATMYFQIGSVLSPYMKRWSVGGSSISYVSTTSGVWRFSIEPQDTADWTATSYYYDVWIRTGGGNKYRIEQGTLQLNAVVGTI